MKHSVLIGDTTYDFRSTTPDTILNGVLNSHGFGTITIHTDSDHQTKKTTMVGLSWKTQQFIDIPRLTKLLTKGGPDEYELFNPHIGVTKLPGEIPLYEFSVSVDCQYPTNKVALSALADIFRNEEWLWVIKSSPDDVKEAYLKAFGVGRDFLDILTPGKFRITRGWVSNPSEKA